MTRTLIILYCVNTLRWLISIRRETLILFILIICVIITKSFLSIESAKSDYEETETWSTQTLVNLTTNSLRTLIEKTRTVKHQRYTKRRPSTTATPLYFDTVLSSQEKTQLEIKLRFSYGNEYSKSPYFNNVIQRCTQTKSRAGHVVFYDSSEYSVNPRHLCSGKLDILIAVHSKPDYFKRRQLIRDTFGSMRSVYGKKITVAFFLGLSKDIGIRKSVYDEIKAHQDIVLKNFVEDYRNMTYKHLAIYDWTMQFCNQITFLVKIDDDVFLNIFQAVTYIKEFNPYSLYCLRIPGAKPMRIRGKWKISYKEYAAKFFPPYCMGFGYILRASHIRDLYWCSIFHNYLWIDDVLVGGVLPEKLRLPIAGLIKGYEVAEIKPSLASHRISDYLFLLSYHKILPDVNEKLWKASLSHSY